MGAGGPIIILKAIGETLKANYTATSPVKVWHTLVGVAVLAFIAGAVVF